jgi:membrane protein implicated in regulation of membrane protease activity
VRTLKNNVGRFTSAALILVILGAWFTRPSLATTFGLIILIGTLSAFLTNGRYALRRVLGVIPTLLFVSFLVFSLVAALPGDPAINILGHARRRYADQRRAWFG